VTAQRPAQTAQKMYAPVVAAVKPERRYRLGPYVAVLFGEIQKHPQAMTEYLHILGVFRPGEGEPFFYVASEVNALASKGGGACFLGVFPGATRPDSPARLNLGCSNDWADADLFTAKALEIARAHLGVTESAVEMASPEGPSSATGRQPSKGAPSLWRRPWLPWVLLVALLAAPLVLLWIYTVFQWILGRLTR
jgi:hypothetical protein